MAIWDLLDQPPRGWLKPAYKYIKDNLGNDLVGVEVGIAQGYGTEYVLDGLSLKKFYMIDPYIPYEFNDTSIEDFNKMYDDTRHKFAMYGNAVLIRTTSEEASKQFEDGSLDFVYIDGNHLYPAVKKDIDIWWPKVRAGGVMGGHDYDIVSSSHNIDTYLYMIDLKMV